MTPNRRQILKSTACALPLLAVPGAESLADESRDTLRAQEVARGLRHGLQFTNADQQVLRWLKRFTRNQYVMGGAVMTRATNRPCDVVHLAALIERPHLMMEAFSGNAPVHGGLAEGNVFCFEHEAQRYRLELVTAKPRPGTTRFAHESLIYDVKTGAVQDAHGILASPSLRSVANLRFDGVLAALIDSEAYGLRIEEPVQREMRSVLGRSQPSAFASFVSRLSRLARLHSADALMNLVSSPAMGSALDRAGLPADALREAFRRSQSTGNPEGARWHACLRDLTAARAASKNAYQAALRSGELTDRAATLADLATLDRSRQTLA